MSVVRPSDSDYLIAELEFSRLIELQEKAEKRDLSARWTSVSALRDQVSDSNVIVRTFLREEVGGEVRAYRCLLMAKLAGDSGRGGMFTLDISPDDLGRIPVLGSAEQATAALHRAMSLAANGLDIERKI